MKEQKKEEIRKEVAKRKRARRKEERKEFGSTVRITLITKAALRMPARRISPIEFDYYFEHGGIFRRW